MAIWVTARQLGRPLSLWRAGVLGVLIGLATLADPWNEVHPYYPGWAHEIWRGLEDERSTSFLVGCSVTIRRPTWYDTYTPP